MGARETKSSWIPTNPDYNPEEPMQVGGQAVLEGVMMRAKGSIATAVRAPSGSIVVRKEKFTSLGERYRILRLPVLRGAVGLVEMMIIGLRTLNFSASVALGETGENGEAAPKPSSTASLVVTLIISLALAIGIFFLLPLTVATKVFHIDQNPLLFNLVAGAIRVVLLLLYLYGISLAKDIHRLFQYHGAEHKSVFAFELNAPLDVEHAIRFTRFHPRCGTSFVLLVMLLSIVLFSLLDAFTLLFVPVLTLPIRFATHTPFVAVVGGIAYEILKFSAKRSGTRFGRIIAAPGLWLQRITTKEPDASMMEVALAALRAALGKEEPAAVRETAEAV